MRGASRGLRALVRRNLTSRAAEANTAAPRLAGAKHNVCVPRQALNRADLPCATPGRPPPHEMTHAALWWRGARRCAMRSGMSSRTALWLAFALLGSACGTSSTPSTDATVDTPRAISTDASVDRVDAGLGCAAFIRCLGACTAPDCVSACQADAAPDSVRLGRALFACVFGDQSATPPVRGACPTAGGGVCDPGAAGYNATACTSCANAAQQVGGACDAQVVACQRSI